MGPSGRPTRSGRRLHLVAVGDGARAAAAGSSRGSQRHSADSADTKALTLQLLREALGADDEERRALHDEVVLLNLDVAHSVVSRYRNRGVPLDDLVQVACLGLVKAAQGFDPAKSDNFLAYAVPTMQGEVKRFFRDSAWTVRPPRRVQELQSTITSAKSLLAQEDGEPPSEQRLADYLGLSRAEVREALAADGCFTPASLDRPVTLDDAATVGDQIGVDEPEFDRVEARLALAPSLGMLSERDRLILQLRFFHEWTQARIAEELGVTQMQVSRLLTRILAQLRQALSPADTEPDTEAEVATTPVRVAAGR